MNLNNKLHTALLQEWGEGKGLSFEITRNIIEVGEKDSTVELHYEFTVPNDNGEDYTMKALILSREANLLHKMLSNLKYDLGYDDVAVEVVFMQKTPNLMHDLKTINKGGLYKIMATIKAIVFDGMRRIRRAGFTPAIVFGDPITNKGETDIDNIRGKMYAYLFQKFMPDGYELFKFPPIIGIKKIESNPNPETKVANQDLTKTSNKPSFFKPKK